MSERKVIDKDPTDIATAIASLVAAGIHLENANKEAAELLTEWLEIRNHIGPAGLRDRTWKWLGSTVGREGRA